jgi:hypothetical protein
MGIVSILKLPAIGQHDVALSREIEWGGLELAEEINSRNHRNLETATST